MVPCGGTYITTRVRVLNLAPVCIFLNLLQKLTSILFSAVGEVTLDSKVSNIPIQSLGSANRNRVCMCIHRVVCVRLYLCFKPVRIKVDPLKVINTIIIIIYA